MGRRSNEIAQLPGSRAVFGAAQPGRMEGLKHLLGKNASNIGGTSLRKKIPKKRCQKEAFV
jgi:hypothetical protein